MLHPWNEAKAAAFLRDRQRLPHALLFSGQKGTGKNSFAAWLAQLLLCASPSAEGKPCNHCQGCRLFVAGSHPDLHVLQPEAVYKSSGTLIAQYGLRYPPEKSKESKESTVIRVDQIRSLIEDAQTRPQIGACTVMLLSPAESMNVNAANSLLKLLEEPPPDSYLILVADRPARLPATIRSRCAHMEFRIPPVDDTLAWLQSQGLSGANAGLLLELAGGAPLTALAMAESSFLDQRTVLLDDMEKLASGQGDPLACAARWKPLGAERCLLWLQGWLNDLIVTAMQVGTARLHNPDLGARLQAVEKRLDLKQLFVFSDGLARGRSLLGGPLDEQLLLEDMLICWTELCRR
ncbi:MAG: DNA polymerase III subunit delta' [Candidatus Muproteobacteria bacterium RBG_19FT_COMBO_61_10]|uniref:DNA polymerase III subunit delta' n=1 Tax=Candidatus Muproteobacteria bacterium RBG_19FT_COMBO_61_10 TaxID=1817761 RepID=A0A1F6UMU9_9PROT|nr:MAG: DNA polymerase III subunit delta' [Candidatus Muproteobacteria bacterium RBG_19FT_COMBO_61_10]